MLSKDKINKREIIKSTGGGARAFPDGAKAGRIAALSVYLILALLWITPLGTAQEAESYDLTELSLEDLMDIEVTSVSKKSEKLSEAAAAIYVLTGEEIIRSGAQTIPDALRMVPGLQVAAIDANTWAISSRGFNGQYSNKLLVLIDGRCVYSPLFSGVWWDIQDVILDDIDRIEVIRGPGATLWGANAVNGVINIITKNAAESLGMSYRASVGTGDRKAVSARYGAGIGEDKYLRVYGKFFDRDGSINSYGIDNADDWRIYRAGLKFCANIGASNEVVFQGDYYNGYSGYTYLMASMEMPYYDLVSDHCDLAGGNMMGRWIKRFNDNSNLTIQAFYDWTRRKENFFSGQSHAADIEVQHNFSLKRSFDIVWGLGQRVIFDDLDDSRVISFPDKKKTYKFSNIFLQCDLQILPQKLKIIFGTKVENNDYTGWEIQPNFRFLLQPDESHTFWGAVSRAVRTPSRGEFDGSVFVAVIPPLSTANPTELAVKIEYQGGETSNSESMISYELGYRFAASQLLSLDISGFYSKYKDLLTGDLGEPTIVMDYSPYILQPIYIHNKIGCESHGYEIALDLMPLEALKLRSYMSYIWMSRRHDGLDGGYSELSAMGYFESQTPEYQCGLNAYFIPISRVSLFAGFKYIGEMEDANIDSYTTIDARISYRFWGGAEAFVIGRNLTNNEHVEFMSEMNRVSTKVERKIYSGISWAF
jgi:iron complex outermembrane receptor protein